METNNAVPTLLATQAAHLVALDIDGTLIHYDGTLAPAVAEAVAAVSRAGHHVVLATGRSLVGVLPIARDLRLRAGAWVIASNGAITARLHESGPQLIHVQPVDVEAVVRLARAALPTVQIAVEEVGWGYRVSSPFPLGEVNGGQREVLYLEELWAAPSPRMILRGRGAATVAPALRALGVSAKSDHRDWVDVTVGHKAHALDRVRAELGVDPAHTVAVGDGPNDVEMLRWASRGVAMGHAGAELRAAADEVTGTIDQDGVVTVLRSLL